MTDDSKSGALAPLSFFLNDEALNSGIVFAAPRLGDAGFDLRAVQDHDVVAGHQVIIKTGVHLAIPQGWVGLIRDRSSMASRKLYTHAGVVDASYRGEIGVLLLNSGAETYRIKTGDKIAQMVIVPHFPSGAIQVKEISELGDTERGGGSFGSTGR